ncbi:MAG TPA: protein translocase subunit SecD [Terriglobales bacterium]|jgi:preprotein translocase subunit SecD|nr:protein translocase subunit SecD [Terriglobales bacterium]
MRKNLLTKTLFIIAVLLIFVYGIFLGTDPEAAIAAWKQHGPLGAIQQNIHLGLDLKGGTHLILQVAVNEAVNAETDRIVQSLRDDLAKAGVSFTDIAKLDLQNHPEIIEIKGVPPDKVGALRSAVSDNFPQYDVKAAATGSYQVVMKPSELTALKQRAVQQAIETIRNRVDQFGVTEPTIQEHGLGDYQILVELPGVDDPARVRDIIQSTAMLDIRLVVGGPYPDEQAAIQANNGVIPPDNVVLPGNSGRADQPEYYVVSRTAAVSGNDIRDAQPSRDENGRPDVNFHLSNDGGRRFQQFTRDHLHERLAIVLDNRVREAAEIHDEIRDNVQITGAFTEQQTQDLSMMLRSGALPASIHYLEEQTVGPSLGADSIRQGVTAAIVGMSAVLIFMLIYYRGAGINADLALVLNLIILLGFLAFFHATLTLPGIAGVILTVGMGVDSNVLIFERIREELRAGKAPAAAVDQGFAHAWLTIVDTHVTTIVSAVILFLFGTGPVKGFATTLTFGLLANLFTAVFVSRVIFDSILNRKERGEALSI